MNKICAIFFVLIFSLKNVRNIDDEEVNVEQPVDGDEGCESGDLRFSIESTSPIEFLKIEKGENIELQCLACGYPRPQIEWLKDDLPPDKWNMTADDVDLEFINDEYKLEITELIEDNSGNYTCVLRNNASSINHTFSVSVKTPWYSESWFYFVLVSILLSCLLAGAAFIQIRNARRIISAIEMPEITT